MVENSSCKEFYICLNNNLKKIKCQNGKLFNNLTKKCDYEAKVKCNDQFFVNILQTPGILKINFYYLIKKFKKFKIIKNK